MIEIVLAFILGLVVGGEEAVLAGRRHVATPAWPTRKPDVSVPTPLPH
jgi:hypothetical protein